MAAGFANRYGGDVLIASSAGLAPIPQAPPDTIRAMNELNVDVSSHIPCRYDPIETMKYDIVINMSGFNLPGPKPKQLIEWDVTDPYGSPFEVYRSTRDDLEHRVMRLILELRRRAKLAV